MTEEEKGEPTPCENFDTCSYYGSPACGFCPCNPDKIRARGPVQQAPEVKFCKEMMVNCGFWDGIQCTHGDNEHPDCMEWLNKHDAALIAQERQKFEHELRSPCGTISSACTLKINELLAREREKWERERGPEAFKPLIHMHDVDELSYADPYNEFLRIYKSLRSEVKK